MSMIDKLINNVPPAQDQTEFNREIRGSGTIPVDVGTIKAEGSFIESFRTHDTAGIYVPLDWIKVDNKSANDILVKLDQREDRAVPISSGQTETVDAGKFRTLEIQNLDNSEIAEDDLRLTVMRRPKTQEDEFRESKKAIQGFK